MVTTIAPVPNKARPFRPQELQAHAPHLAAFEADMAQQSAALWMRHAMGAMSWTWWRHNIAPTAFIEDANTGYTFDFYKTGTGATSYGLRLPWLYHPEAQKIRADIYFVATYAPIALALRVNDFIANVTAETGVYSLPATQLVRFQIPFMHWRNNLSTMGGGSMYRASVEIAPSSTLLAITRRFALQVRAQYIAPQWPYEATLTLPVYLLAMQAYNVPADPIF